MTANSNLVCPQLALLCHLKHSEESKKRIIESSIGEGMELYKKNTAPINVLGWTIKDNNELEHLNSEKITLEETEVGRQAINLA